MKLVVPEYLKLPFHSSVWDEHLQKECGIEAGDSEKVQIQKITERMAKALEPFGLPPPPEKSSPERERHDMCLELVRLITKYNKRIAGVAIKDIKVHALSIAEKGYMLPPLLMKMLVFAFSNPPHEGRKKDPFSKKAKEAMTIIKIYHLLMAGGEQYFDFLRKDKNKDIKTRVIGECCNAMGMAENTVTERLTMFNSPQTDLGIVEQSISDLWSQFGPYIEQWFTESVKRDRHGIKKLPVPNRSFHGFVFGEATPDSLKRLHDFLKEHNEARPTVA